jgi:acyl carrier protein
MNEIVDILIEYIRNETGHTSKLAADDDLLQTGVLDSFNIVALALFAQERFGVELEGEDLIRDNLARLSALAALIEKRRAEQA